MRKVWAEEAAGSQAVEVEGQVESAGKLVKGRAAITEEEMEEAEKMECWR
jgi:hypothetical protein